MVKVLIICEKDEAEKIAKLAFANNITRISVEESPMDGRMSGNELRKIRNELHMTQQQFADKVAGTAQSAICKMERGAIKVSSEVAEAALVAKENKQRPPINQKGI